MSGGEVELEALRWLRYASDDLVSGRVLLAADESPPRGACWLAQQAAEKALKGALIFLQVEFPRTHDLDLLRNRLPLDWQIQQLAQPMIELRVWAVQARYPGDWAEATHEDAVKSISQADDVLHIVRADLLRLGYLTSTD